MTNLRQAAQRALKAMEDGEDRADMIEFSDALIALRQALAEPEQEQPAAWMDIDDKGQKHGLRYYSDGSSDEVPLYTAPTPRKPLTDEEIQSIWAKTFEMGSSANTFARAIERAHGIGEQND